MLSNELLTSLSTVALALIGVAFIAVILSKNAQTTTVASSLGNAFTSALGAAEGPVSSNIL